MTALNSVLGNTQVNTLRVGWTQEDVSFANPCFNGNGRDQGACPPTLAYQTFTDQQNETAQARVNDAIQVEDTLSWFLPDKKGDHDVKFGVQWQYSQSRNDTQDELNGTFSVRPERRPPSMRPIRGPIPSASRSASPGQAAASTSRITSPRFVQDKWKLNNRLTLSLGLRYDLEVIPINEIDNPLFGSPSDYPVDKNNFQPRVGFAYDVDGGISVIRGGYGRFFDKTHFELIGGIYTGTRVRDLVQPQLPVERRRSGTTQRAASRPIRSWSTAR